MNDQHPTIDPLLQSALGSATLSPEQRRRHLDLIATRASSRRRPMSFRFLRDGAVAIILVAFMVVAYTMLPLNDSSDSGITPAVAVASIREATSAPEPGHARYTRLESELRVPPGAPIPEWTNEVWERTTQEGEFERAINAYDPDGEFIGRTVETNDGWFVETPETFTEGSNEEFVQYPPELFQVLTAPRIGPDEGNMSEFFEAAEQGNNTTIVEEGDTVSVTATNPFEDQETDGFAEQFGFPVSAFSIEITVDTEENQMVQWRWIAEDEQGERHVIQSIRYSDWEEMDASDVPEDVFAERTDVSEQEVKVP